MYEDYAGRPARHGSGTWVLRLMALGACALLCWVVCAAFQPYLQAARMQRENDRAEARLLEARLRVQELRKEAAGLRTRPGREKEARRSGFLRPGEAPLIVPDEEPPARAPLPGGAQGQAAPQAGIGR